jgi:VanZ family protein
LWDISIIRQPGVSNYLSSVYVAVLLTQNDNHRTGVQPVTRFVLLTAVTVAVIVYGSLYPFKFYAPATRNGPINAFVDSWAIAPGRDDFIANVLLYMPLGWFGVLSLPQRLRLRLLLVVISGIMLSVVLELAQYFDAGRTMDANDVYANSLGTIMGTLSARHLYQLRRVPLLSNTILANELLTKPIPVALIAAWAGYRLYPYVPTSDLHKYWHALKPIILNPTLSLEGLYRHTTIWLTIFALIGALVGYRRAAMLAPLFCACTLAARILVVGTMLSVSEVIGAAAAVCLWPVLISLSNRQCTAALFLLLGSAVIIERLQPFQFQSVARDFGWLPFRSLMGGSIAVNVMAFFEKSFLYGSLLYLFTEAGGRLRTGVLIVGLAVFATSWTQSYLPGRSAEITDLMITLLIAGGFALVSRHRRETGAPQRSRLSD